MIRLKGITAILVAFLVPLFVNTLLFIWSLIRIGNTGSKKEELHSFFIQLSFALIFAVGTFFTVRFITEQLFKILSFAAFLPVLVFLCFRLYFCSIYERSSVICEKLPRENILFAIVFLFITLRVFLQWTIIAGNVQYLEKLQDSTLLLINWTYGALLYLLPALEFFAEIVFFPGFKNAKTWFGFVSNCLGKLAAIFGLYKERLVQFIIAVYMITFVVYIIVIYQQRYYSKYGWFIFETVLMFFLLIIEQFLLINPISLVVSVIVFIVWNVWKRPSFGSYDINYANTESEMYQSFNYFCAKEFNQLIEL